ncbi:MAG: FAD-dependent oxidoreductase [Pseudomonadota bacterium]
MTQATPTDVMILGAGLSGLAAALAARDAGLGVGVLEARDRVGGRAWSPRLGGVPVDAGPAWLWPRNPRALALAKRLGLAVFPQHADGRLVFEDRAGAVRRDLDMATMGGALRVEGGLGALAEAAADALPPASLRLNAPVAALRLTPKGVEAADAAGAPLAAARAALLALPPRLAATLHAAPDWSAPTRDALADAPGWMAAQAKLVAVYDAPFWRDAGLNGDAVSHRGPLVEIHDASPRDGAGGALFGFLGGPPAARAGRADALRAAALDQLVRLFGPRAGRPQALLLQDWAADPLTAAPRDRDEAPRPPPGGAPSPDAPWAGRLIFAGAEHDDAFPGYVEGAIRAGEAAAQVAARAAAAALDAPRADP